MIFGESKISSFLNNDYIDELKQYRKYSSNHISLALLLHCCQCYGIVNCTLVWSNKNRNLLAIRLLTGLHGSGHAASWGLVWEHQTLDLLISKKGFVFIVH